MINAIGLDAAREEEEDAVDSVAAGQEDQLLASDHRASQELQQGQSTHSSDEESESEGHMKATISDHARGKRRLPVLACLAGRRKRSVMLSAPGVVSHENTQRMKRRCVIQISVLTLPLF